MIYEWYDIYINLACIFHFRTCVLDNQHPYCWVSLNTGYAMQWSRVYSRARKSEVKVHCHNDLGALGLVAIPGRTPLILAISVATKVEVILGYDKHRVVRIPVFVSRTSEIINFIHVRKIYFCKLLQKRISDKNQFLEAK